MNKLYKYQRLRKNWQYDAVENMFRHEKDIRLAVQQQRNDNGSKQINSSGKLISDPTATEAIRNLAEVTKIDLPDGTAVEYPEKWLLVIEKSYEQCGDDKIRKAIRMRFEDGVFYGKICRKFDISTGVFYSELRKLLAFALAGACQMGLVEVILIKK